MEVPIGKFNAVHIENDLLFVAAEVYIRAWSMEVSESIIIFYNFRMVN
jgi:hypothetical protein